MFTQYPLGPGAQFPYNSFPSGTALLFQQTTAPTGWTKSTTHNDKALRVVSGSVGSGGTTAFSSTFATPQTNSTSLTTDPVVGNTGSTALSISQIPSHAHNIAVTDRTQPAFSSSSLAVDRGNDNLVAVNVTTNANGSGAGHSHDLGSHTHTVAAHSHSIALAVQYVDVIIATKD